MSIGAALLYLAVLVAVSFTVSGAVPRYREVVARRKRVGEFQRQYAAWVAAEGRVPDDDEFIGMVLPDGLAEDADDASKEVERLRPRLVARRTEMQRDAQAVGKGIMNVAPPPDVGGRYQAHAYFADLFSFQSYRPPGSPSRAPAQSSSGRTCIPLLLRHCSAGPPNAWPQVRHAAGVRVVALGTDAIQRSPAAEARRSDSSWLTRGIRRPIFVNAPGFAPPARTSAEEGHLYRGDP
jgi:hypothetical protein